jgi:hypothetical protein
VRAEVRDGDYVRIEVRDAGGPWNEHCAADTRPHGLAIVCRPAVGSGVDGDALTGWIAWARINWVGARSSDGERTPPGGTGADTPWERSGR